MNFLKTVNGRSLQSLTVTWMRCYAAKPSTAGKMMNPFYLSRLANFCPQFLALGKKVVGGGKKGGKLGAVVEKKIMPVETDPKKLVSFVCGSNINIKGEDVKVNWF